MPEGVESTGADRLLRTIFFTLGEIVAQILQADVTSPVETKGPRRALGNNLKDDKTLFGANNSITLFNLYFDAYHYCLHSPKFLSRPDVIPHW